MADIVAVVTMNRDFVAGGGAPVFIMQSEKGLQEVAFLLEKIMDASAHDLKNGTIIIVDHQ
ncbi:hypothetical protein M6D81_15135 [Paenibacillus sp. J5C_2022]|uniref:capping complex subunit for YIEGIA n=1 Tax=Paenibacillus sp. J5C2022 TaxID=2977129 RepID=UPI0021D2E369|nr:hypothetical protein [Paenibacillus sp. J5C2022]MCU6710029.1 hypothetical protein [Paenibacillus sp. J5C2022]